MVDNSISTNFVDIPSLNENYTISANENNNQLSFTYNKKRDKNNLFLAKENNLKNMQKKIYIKKNNNNNSKTIDSKNTRKASNNKLALIKHLNDDIYNTIFSNSLKNKSTNKIHESNKEKKDDFVIINNLLNAEKNNSENLKIISGAVKNNINNEGKKNGKLSFVSQQSEPFTIQSMSDSRILEMANYYLKEEETVDKTEISNVLTTKKNVKNYN